MDIAVVVNLRARRESERIARACLGNAWAGAPRWRRALAELGRLARRRGALPLRRFDLIEIEDLVGHFAGSGWDAELVDDFNAQKTGAGVLPRRLRQGVAGYVEGVPLRTIPRHVFHPGRAVEVELTNSGGDALTVDGRGRAIPLRGGGHGKVLYRDPMSIRGAATTRAWGFDFRAFPFAGISDQATPTNREMHPR